MILAPTSTSPTDFGWINRPGLSEGVDEGEGGLPSSWLIGMKFGSNHALSMWMSDWLEGGGRCGGSPNACWQGGG